ncbi:MAG TPA: nuclear transport factor 2 family protein [Polyangiales bacterium]|nr:nuclear transport factor 2 family protein [Polyangiales bacterium]
MKAKVSELVRECYAAFVRRDRERLEQLFSDDFAFSSPRDDRIDKARYFERCWPNGDKFAAIEVEQLFSDGDEAVARYRCQPKPGAAFAPFRNIEYFRTEDGRIKEIEVYFGRSLPDERSASTQRDEPRATPEQQRLEPFVGDWALTGRQLPGPFGPAADISARESFAWLQGGKFLVHRFDGRLGDHPMACIEMVEPDSQHDGYRLHAFYDDGRVQQWQQTTRDGLWITNGDWPSEEGSMKVRCTQRFEDDGKTRSARWERSRDGQRWETFWEVTAAKQA